MHRHRIRKLQSIMQVPGCLFHDPVDIFYLTGVQVEGFFLLVTKKKVVAFAPPLLRAQITQLAPWVLVLSGDNIITVSMDFLKKHRIRKVGMNEKTLTCALAKRIAKQVKIADISPRLGALRQIKGAEEIQYIKKSCKIAAMAFSYARRITRAGMTESKIALKIDEFFLRHAVKPSFPVIVASGPNSALPHHIPGHRKIEKNDVVLIDLGCIYQGYCSDLTRTFFLGRISELQKSVYALVRRAQGSALRAVKKGATAAAIDGAARACIVRGGFGREFIHSTGHGVGLEIHEAPRIAGKNKARIKPGMVITVEPGIYLPRKFGVRIEDTVLITTKGYEVLTR